MVCVQIYLQIVFQVMSTALLMLAIMAITDRRNMKVKSGLVPFYVGLALTTLILGFGFHTGAGLNPARDLAP